MTAYIGDERKSPKKTEEKSSVSPKAVKPHPDAKKNAIKHKPSRKSDNPQQGGY